MLEDARPAVLLTTNNEHRPPNKGRLETEDQNQEPKGRQESREERRYAQLTSRIITGQLDSATVDLIADWPVIARQRSRQPGQRRLG